MNIMQNGLRRTFLAQPGVIVADIRAGDGHVTVSTIAGLPQAQVTVRSAGPHGYAADLVRRTTIRQFGRVVRIQLPRDARARQSRVAREAPGPQRLVPPGAEAANGESDHGIVTTTAPPTGLPDAPQILLRLTPGCSVRLRARDAGVTVRGGLEKLDVITHGGALHADTLGSLVWEGYSHPVTLMGPLTGTAQIRSYHGAVTLSAYAGREARIATHDGRVSVSATARATGRLAVTSNNGDIRLVGTNRLSVKAISDNGRVTRTAARTRRNA